MNIHKLIVGSVAILTLFSLVYAGSTKTTTIRKEGKKITTKIKTDNKGTTTTTITTKDKAGNVEKTTTVADKDGNILSTDDPNARAKAEAVAKKKKENQKALANTPKRGPSDPIQMALFQTVVGENLRKATKKQGGVFPFFRKEFETDKVIKIMNQKKVDSYLKNYDFKTGQYKKFSGFDRDPRYLPADIYVESNARLKEKYGISKATKKAASASYLFYKAIIHSEYSDQTWEVTESGHILKNQAVTKKFAKKIHDVILNKAGPHIPADAANFRRGKGVEVMDGKDVRNAFRNLFKKKKK